MESQPETSAAQVRAMDRPVVVVPVFLLIAVVGGTFDSFSVSANLLVLAVGGAMVWLATAGRTSRRPPPARLGRPALWWVLPVALFVVTELGTFLMRDFERYPTLSLLADPLLENHLARAACYFGWLYGFWGLIRR